MDNKFMTPTEDFAQRLVKQSSLPLDELLIQPAHSSSNLQAIVNNALGKKNMSVSMAAELSGINRASLYKILDGQVQPQRNTLLRLALTLELDFSETQQLLKAGNASLLSVERLRDQIIMVGLVNQAPIDEISRTLEKHGFINLYAKV